MSTDLSRMHDVHTSPLHSVVISNRNIQHSTDSYLYKHNYNCCFNNQNVLNIHTRVCACTYTRTHGHVQ